MTVRGKLQAMIDELEAHKKSVDALKEGVAIKLDRDEQNYRKVVIKNCDYILSRSNSKVLRALAAYQKRKSKKDGKESH